LWFKNLCETGAARVRFRAFAPGSSADGAKATIDIKAAARSFVEIANHIEKN
jgi:hypothetical protein